MSDPSRGDFQGVQEEDVNLPESIEADSNGDAEAASGKTRRERIDVSGLRAKEIQDKYGVSRATSYRGEKRGWVFVNYHQKEIEIDSEWAERNVGAIMKSAEIGSRNALRRMGMSKSELTIINFSDLVSAGYVRLMELSGHERREDEGWRVIVARNAAFDLLKTQHIGSKKLKTR